MARNRSHTRRRRSAWTGLALLMITAASFGVANTTALAQPTDLTGFTFLRIEPSARASALGGSFVAIYDGDVNTLFYNPSLLSESTDGRLSLSYLNHVSDVNAGFVAYGREYAGIGSFAAGVRFLNWGGLQGATETGERTGTFGAGDVALTVGGARSATDKIRYGANAHVIYSGVEDYSATALAADLGVTYFAPGSALTVSAAVRNLGFVLSSLGTRRDRLPVDLQVGLTKRVAHLPLLMSITGYNLHDYGTVFDDATVVDNVLYHIALGGEFQFSEAFQLRIGYNHRRHDELRTKARLDFAGFALGVGIHVRRFSFDYSYNSWSELGGLNQLTVGTHL